MGQQSYSIQILPVAAVVLDPGNPRHHSARQVRQIAKSIESFGFNVPILVDRTNKILAGHGRVLAAQSLGLQELPAVRLEHLSEAQSRAFMIADNRLTETSVWDDCKIARNFDPTFKVSQRIDLVAKYWNWEVHLSRPIVTPPEKWILTSNQ